MSLLEKVEQKLKENNSSYWVYPTEEGDLPPQDKDYAQFYFIGIRNEEKVLFDCFLCTLELNYHETILYEAEEMYESRGIQSDSEENYELYIAELMDELEEIGEIQVQEKCEEHDEIEEESIVLDVSLNRPEINDFLIREFIEQFNANTLKLDPVRYSFYVDTEK